MVSAPKPVFRRLDLHVFLRSRCLVFQRQLNPENDVNGKSSQHNQPEDPDEWSETMQLLRICVDCVSTYEDGRVAQQVHTNKRDQHDAGNGHDDLSAHRTLRQLHDFDPLLNVVIKNRMKTNSRTGRDRHDKQKDMTIRLPLLTEVAPAND